jgi:hypothetical protein
VAVAGFVSSDLIHPHIDEQHVREGQAEERYLLLEYFLVGCPFLRVEALGVDDIEMVGVVEPYALGAPFPGDRGVEDWKLGEEDVVEEGALAGALGAEDGHIGVGGGKGLEVLAAWGGKYLNWQS